MASAAAAEPRRAPGGGLFVPSTLWLDQEDARERIDEKRRSHQIGADTARGLSHFAEQGHLIFSLDVDPATFDQLLGAVDRRWEEKPADLAYAYDGPARRMTHADEARERRTRYRIHDLHSHSPAALALYLNRQIFDWVDLILGEEPVAIQSLTFEYGSQQLLHRDQVVVPTASPGHLVAAWIALEDIGPDCGPLVYVPGSHRLPCYETAPGEYEFDGRRMGPEVVEAGLAWEAEQERRRGLEPRLFTARRGDVLLWHAALRHGGSEVRDERLTRRSFVVHYSTRSTYDRRSITLGEPVEGGERWQVLETRELLERDGCHGFQNPLLGYGAG
jgi:ectoine hydroxylase-related dioxygenase (phytanoyl-CoA dioxygenase family)